MSTLRRRLGVDGAEQIGGHTPEPDFNELVGRVQSELLRDYPDLVASGLDPEGRGRVRLQAAIKGILAANGWARKGPSLESLASRLVDEVSGYGPITPLLADESVDEIMVNGPHQIFVERRGHIEKEADLGFRDDDHLMSVISRMVAPLGRRVDRSSPHVDGRLPDGSRVHVILPPLSLVGPTLTIRKFRSMGFEMEDLVANGTLSPEAAEFMEIAVRGRLNAVVAGGAGAGKTTTLNVLLNLLERETERVITMEDAAELKFRHPHAVALETRPPNLEGKGEVTMRQLLRNALRMRPDRLIMGEVRGQEAFDLLQAMNTGHDGCLSTVHASGAEDALRRLENMVLMSGHRMGLEAASRQLKSALDLVIFQLRTPAGRRMVVEIAMVVEGARTALLPVFRTQGPERALRPVGEGLPAFLKERLNLYGINMPAGLIGHLGGWLGDAGGEGVLR